MSNEKEEERSTNERTNVHLAAAAAAAAAALLLETQLTRRSISRYLSTHASENDIYYNELKHGHGVLSYTVVRGKLLYVRTYVHL